MDVSTMRCTYFEILVLQVHCTSGWHNQVYVSHVIIRNTMLQTIQLIEYDIMYIVLVHVEL